MREWPRGSCKDVTGKSDTSGEVSVGEECDEADEEDGTLLDADAQYWGGSVLWNARRSSSSLVDIR